MTKKSIRHSVAQKLVEMGKRHPNLVVLEADLQDSTQSVQFQKAFPDRYIQVGIAEQNMMGIAAGLAACGKIPVAYTFACFASMRACEQVRTSVAYPNLNVKIFVSHCGVSAGTAGTSHHAIEDIAIMRAIPNMTVIAPGDAKEAAQAAEAAVLHAGPVYLRMAAIDIEDIYHEQSTFNLGKATLLREGKDATIITTGPLMNEGVAAADKLRQEYGIFAGVLQMATVKPIDREAILFAARQSGRIITVEDHTILGGLGSAVCEIVAEIGNAKVKRIGINDRFVCVGTPAYIMEREGITVQEICRSTIELIKISAA